MLNGMAYRPELPFINAERLKLLLHLVTHPRTPTELAALEKKHLSHISRTLGELRRQGLVELAEARSRERYYRPTRDGYKVCAFLVRQPG